MRDAERDIENDIAKPGMKEEMDRQQDADADTPADVHSKTELRRRIRDQLRITRGRNQDLLDEYREGMDRRTFLKTLGFGVAGFLGAATIGGVMTKELFRNKERGGTPTGYAGTPIADAPGSNEVRVSSIDEAVSQFQSGNKVILAEGTYSWDGDGIFGEMGDASLIGDGPVTLQVSDGTNVHGDIFATDGDVMVKNITIKGRQGGGKNRIRLEARSGTRMIAENFNQPDGADGDGHPSPIGFYLGNNTGEVHIRSCHIEGFYNNGIYGGSYYKEGDGSQIVEGCFLKNNGVDHLRMGGHGDLCRETVLVSDGTGAYSGYRGIRVRYGGSNQRIENTHFAWEADAGSPFRVGEGEYMEGSPQVTVDGIYIRNETDSTAMQIGGDGETTGQNICLKGSGDLSISGGDFQDVRRGDECTETVKSTPPDDINYRGASGASTGPDGTASSDTPC